MVDRIGYVAVGDWVALAPSRRAPLYQVTEITGRHIRLTPLDPSKYPRTVPVQNYRALITVAWDDPRRDEIASCGQ